MLGVHSRGLKFGPIAEANHAAESTLGCDPVIIFIMICYQQDRNVCNHLCHHYHLCQDYGWSDGADGTGKCYMLIKNFDYRSAIRTLVVKSFKLS